MAILPTLEIEDFSNRVAAAKTQEDLFVLLSQVAHHFDHDCSIIQQPVRGIAEDLLISLRNALLLRDGSKRQYFRSKLSHDRALQCTVLVTAIEMMLRCPKECLTGVDLFREELDLVSTIPETLNLMLAWDGGETESIRMLGISKSIKVIRRIADLQKCASPFLDALLNVLRSHVPPEIHVEASTAIAHLCSVGKQSTIARIQDDSSLIISALSTAALQDTHEEAEEILTGIFDFAVNSHIFRAKIAKRRCAILSISKHLSSVDVESRKLALNICKCLFNDQIQAETEPIRMEIANYELLIGEIMILAESEKEPMIQLYAIGLLGDAVRNLGLAASFVNKILDGLKELVDSDGHDDVLMEASVAYTNAVASMLPENITEDALICVVDFMTLPFARTRKHALTAIELFIANDRVAQLLLAKTEMLDNAAMILNYGSSDDANDVIHIISFLSRNPAHHNILRQNTSFLNALIKLVTQEEVIDRTSYATGLEAILSLLSNGDDVRAFLPFPDLLPVLVSLANTVSEEESKHRLVTATVRLSSAILS